MSKTKVMALVAGALVAGLVLGSLGIASAATSTTTGGGYGLGPAIRDAGARLLDVVASLTGKPVADVQAARAEGESFDSIAKASGVSSDKVVDTTLQLRKEVLDARVKAGTMTQAQADDVLAFMKTRVEQRISSTTPCAGGAGAGGGRMGGGRMGGGAGAGAGCGGACVAPTN